MQMMFDPSLTPLSLLPLIKMNLSCLMLGRLLLMGKEDVRPWTVCNASGCKRLRNQNDVGSLRGEGYGGGKHAAGKIDCPLRYRDGIFGTG